MINLNYRKKDIRKFINLLEESIITFLSNYGIRSRSFKNRVGVWVTEIKGLKLKKEKIGSYWFKGFKMDYIPRS